MPIASKERTKVLVVDDSLVFRSAVAKALAESPDIEVVGSVRNGAKAIQFIKTSKPDVVSLDVEMPEMDGIETLAAIQEWNAEQANTAPIGVIMLSAHTQCGTESTLKALELGAFDFVTKPKTSSITESITHLNRQLVAKIRNFVSTRQRRTPIVELQRPVSLTVSRPAVYSPKPKRTGKANAVVIGVSTGGPRALSAMMPELTKRVHLPIFIVQHMPAGFTKSLAKSLDMKCASRVVEAEDGQRVEANHVYVAQGGSHMIVARDNGEIVTRIVDGLPENGCKPAVDVLFRSANAIYQDALVAVVLTGMGSDGAKSAAMLHERGGHVVAQDEASSVVWGMPGAAVAAGAVDEVVTLMDVPNAVAKAAGCE